MTQRDALLDAAITCLRERGYARTTSRDILAQAGISSLAAIVYHYGSKEQLLNEAFAALVEDWIRQLECLSAGKSAEEGISVLVTAAGRYYEQLAASRDILAIFIEALGRAEQAEDVRTQLAGHYERFRSLVAGMLVGKDDSPRREEGRTLASLLIAMSDGLLIQWLLDPTQTLTAEDLRNSVRALAAPFVAGSN